MYGNEFLNRFIKRLEEVGFPEDSIVSEYKVMVNNICRVIDIAIIDPVTNTVLSIFEIKLQINKKSEQKLIENAQVDLLKSLNLLHNNNIHAYIVIVKEDGNFTIFPFEVGKNGNRIVFSAVALENIIPFSVLRNKSRANAIKKTSSEIKRTTDWFKITCWICAIISIILAILDNLKYITISNIQLALFGVAIALIIMPFSKKLKILGVEFERLTVEKKDIKN